MKLEKILEHNKLYKEKQDEVKALFQELKGINDKIDLDEIKLLKYADVKELLETIKYCINDEDKLKAIEDIKNDKKIKEYPEILGVHYYPEINEIDLSEDAKVKLINL